MSDVNSSLVLVVEAGERNKDLKSSPVTAQNQGFLFSEKEVAMKNLGAAIDRVKTEKRLKAKEAKLQSKLASLTASV